MSHDVRERPRLTLADIRSTAERLKQWGKWGADDEIGTLNYTTADDIVAAAGLVRKGRVFSLAIDFDHLGPQGKSDYANIGRFNPVHSMIRTGTDAYSGVMDKRGIRAADDMITMPLQAATHWDGLSHIFYGDQMWNGYDCRLVDGFGAQKNGIEKTRAKFVGRGVLVDVPRHVGMDVLPDGFAITSDLIQAAIDKQGYKVGRGDFMLVRTGHIEAKRPLGWKGFAGGDAPGMAFETLDWLKQSEIAALAMDTWGCEVRPNETSEATQPWHWICIPILGLTMGEMFDLELLAKDCAEDGCYEFFFAAPAVPFTGAVGAPTNPLAIK